MLEFTYMNKQDWISCFIMWIVIVLTEMTILPFNLLLFIFQFIIIAGTYYSFNILIKRKFRGRLFNG